MIHGAVFVSSAGFTSSVRKCFDPGIMNSNSCFFKSETKVFESFGVSVGSDDLHCIASF